MKNKVIVQEREITIIKDDYISLTDIARSKNSDEPSPHQTFENIKQIDNNGNEFWYARSLSKILGYTDFRNFIKVIEKAKEACENSGFEIADHIVEVNEMVLLLNYKNKKLGIK